jgi:hypothetical protein
VKLPVHTIKPLTAAYKSQGHAFTPEQVILNAPSASKILPTVEEMVEVLERALTEKAPPRTSPTNAPASTRRATSMRR